VGIGRYPKLKLHLEYLKCTEGANRNPRPQQVSQRSLQVPHPGLLSLKLCGVTLNAMDSGAGIDRSGWRALSQDENVDFQYQPAKDAPWTDLSESEVAAAGAPISELSGLYDCSPETLIRTLGRQLLESKGELPARGHSDIDGISAMAKLAVLTRIDVVELPASTHWNLAILQNIRHVKECHICVERVQRYIGEFSLDAPDPSKLIPPSGSALPDTKQQDQ
jgi:hypothetical protein